MYMHEFYFDEPVTVKGLFFIGITQIMVSNTCNTETDLRRNHLYRQSDTTCWPEGYMMEVRLETGAVLKGNITDNWYEYTAHGNYKVVPEPGSLKTPYEQILFPIASVEGNGMEPAGGAGSVMRLYPNPASGSVTVSAVEGIERVTVMDMTGRTVQEHRYDGRPRHVALDVRTLPCGAYAVRATTAAGTVMEKLVLQ